MTVRTDNLTAPTYAERPVDHPVVGDAITAPVRAGAVAAGVALVLNTALFVAVAMTGASFLLQPPGGAAFPATLVSVVIASVVPVALATVALALVRRSRGAVIALAWAGLAVGVATALFPLSMSGDLTVRIALAAMHLITGVAWFVSVRRAQH